jgi:hypothetical protein
MYKLYLETLDGREHWDDLGLDNDIMNGLA